MCASRNELQGRSLVHPVHALEAHVQAVIATSLNTVATKTVPLRPRTLHEQRCLLFCVQQ